MTDAVNPAEIAAPDANVAPEPETVADPSPAVDETNEQPAKPKGVQVRLDELTRLRRDAERDRDYWRELALRNQSPQPKADSPKPDDKPKTLADFEYDEAKFQAYIFDQAERRSAEAARRELKEAQERETRTRRDQSFASKAIEFAKTVEDYDEVVRNPSLPITPQMAEAIKDSDDGPALAYHLGKNPDIAEKIAQLPPIAAARELGKIEARLAQERERAKEARPAVSNAPPPPPKVEGVEPAVNIRPDDPESDKLPMNDWLAKRNKQIAKRRG